MMNSRNRGFCGALLVALLCGCGTDHIRQLRDAEDTFSQASRQHNRDVLDPDPARSAGETITGFRLAAQMTAALLDKQAAELRQDNLLCTAITIRALSLVRLGEYAEAIAIADRSGDCTGGHQLPRERALLRSVPALARIERANELLANGKASPDDYLKQKEDLAKALKELDEARGAVPGGHPVRGYFVLSQLAALRVWQGAAAGEGLKGRERDEAFNEVKAQAANKLRGYREYMECEMRRKPEEYQAALQGWQKALGFAERVDVNCAPAS